MRQIRGKRNAQTEGGTTLLSARAITGSGLKLVLSVISAAPRNTTAERDDRPGVRRRTTC